ncbi:MAG: hypothetical protein COB67_01605 [SAR324 cluster bacterium]|uniref:Methyltransferase type 11 domain-containing protein n=1 Tax=SAR324 cluster bacterium TaxID=2024889 RepID=A0A2A4TAV4_9DELT|nr:MAG: hypothetical protein COB67_01605 [SAR324 cluster bacterium]
MVKQKVDAKEVGLDVGLILAKHFYKTDYLHYGYWTDDLSVESGNIVKAQENYAEYLLKHMPEGVKSILEVGCGSGKFTARLLDMGYQVDCVSPSPNLTRHVRQRVDGRGTIFECGYEDVQTEKKYDLVLFSESFQYIPLKESLTNTTRFLNDGGHLLICDFFRTGVSGTSPIGGGHDLKKFYHQMSQYPFEILVDEDITKETAPSMDIVNDFLTEVLKPVYDLIFYVLDNNYPKISKFIRWKWAKKIKKVDRKYFQQRSNAASFAHFKSYHLLLCQKK